MALLIHLLACAFGLGSWVAVNGLWVELPLIVNTLPEGWNLPSYLTVIIQLANVGPLLVTLMHKLCPGRLKEPVVIVFILCVGVLSCVLLAFFWDRTSVVAGRTASTAFFILTFFLSLVDCTSSVTFLPFMMQLPAKYITTFYIGEGLSGFVPGVVALAQGVGIAKCVNSTGTPAGNNTDGNLWSLQAEYMSPTFSTQVFFFLLAAMMVISLSAFFALNKMPRTYEVSTENLVSEDGVYVSSGLDNPGAELDGEAVKSKGEGEGEGEAQSRPRLASADYSVCQTVFIYSVVLWINAATNGLLPSVQTYSCIPYGNLAYHLSAALSSVANPLACTVAMFFQNRSLVFLGLLTALGTGFGSYNMAMAAMSPCPLLQGSVMGEVFIVSETLKMLRKKSVCVCVCVTRVSCQSAAQ
ncbi:solute carrier family 52, riboflavin transporter, member 3-A, partial [Cynoglossus semilaevis]